MSLLKKQRMEQLLLDYFDDEHADFPISNFTETLACVEWLKERGILYKDIARFGGMSDSAFSQWRIQRQGTERTQMKMSRALNRPFQDCLLLCTCSED
jgi:hypothetical protein